MAERTSLLPPNATALERAAERVDVQLAYVPMSHQHLWNPWQCQPAFLPYLAWSVSVDTWNSDWPEYVKRSQIASSFAIQRHKGTAQSIADVVASFGGQVQIVEWWQTTPKGTPHTFELQLTLSGQNGTEVSADYVNQVMAAVERAKPVRSHFTFTQGVNAVGCIGVLGVVRTFASARLDMAAIEPQESP